MSTFPLNKIVLESWIAQSNLVDLSSRALSPVQSVRGSVLLKQDDLGNQFYFITVKLAFPGTGCEVCEVRTEKNLQELSSLFFSLFYLTLGSACTFYPSKYVRSSRCP